MKLLFFAVMLLLSAPASMSQEVIIRGQSKKSVSILPNSNKLQYTFEPLDWVGEDTVIRFSAPGIFQIDDLVILMEKGDRYFYDADSMRLSVPMHSTTAKKLFAEVDAVYETGQKLVKKVNPHDVVSQLNKVNHAFQDKTTDIEKSDIDSDAKATLKSYAAISTFSFFIPYLRDSSEVVSKIATHSLTEVIRHKNFDFTNFQAGRVSLLQFAKALGKYEYDIFLFEETNGIKFSSNEISFMSIQLLTDALLHFKMDLSLGVLKAHKEYLSSKSDLSVAEGQMITQILQSFELKGKDIFEVMGDILVKNESLKVSKFTSLSNGQFENVKEIYIWATWCAPCMQHIRSVMKTPDFEKNTILLSIDKDEKKWQSISAKMGLKTSNSYLVEESLVDKFRIKVGIDFLPFSLLLNRRIIK